MAVTARTRTRTGSALLSIDRECDSFETDWRAGRNPRIEEALTRLPAEARRIALRELLGIELELRRQRGDEISKAEYQQRFPDSAAIVDEVVESASRQLEATVAVNPAGDTVPSSATTCTRYHDLRFFRRGGLGALYRAIDESLHRETVVKFMNDQTSPDPALVAQFNIEAEVTGRLDHPGIVPVYGIGQDWHGRPFYVMRLINGRELKEAIQEYHHGEGSSQRGSNRRQQLFTLLEHLTSACNTVAYAHHVGIVHCDLKPANIMIGKYGETFVLDWGLATNFERSTTFFSPNEPTMRPHAAPGGSSSGQRGGTYGYISPEQLLADGPIGPSSDVYSLGATLYEILTGQAPFNGRDTNVREHIRQGEFVLPRRLNPHICPKLEAICLKAMSLSPQLRYPTAKLLATELTNLMRDEEVQAAPDRWFDRLTRFGRRHRGVTSAFFLTLITILMAAGLTVRAIEKAKHAEAEQQGFTIALDAFEGQCRPFANGEMGNLETFRPTAEEIKKFTKVYLERLEKKPSMRLHTARVFELRSTVSQFDTGNSEQALIDLKQAEDLYKASSATERNERELRLAQNHISQGRIYIQRNEFDLAMPVLESAAESLEQAEKAQPQDMVVRRHLAEALHCIGEVHLNRRTEGAARRQAAEDKFNRSKSIREKLVQESAGEDRRNHERDLARSYGYLGDVYRYQGNIPAAAEAYEDSKRLRQTLYNNNKNDPEHRFQFARGLANFGELDRGYRRDLQNAIEQLERAEEIQLDLTNDFPDMLDFLIDRAGNQAMLADIYLMVALEDNERAAERRKKARTAVQQARDIYGRLRKQNNPSGLSGLAQCAVLLAVLDQESNPDQSQRQAREAEGFLVSKPGGEAVLSGSELATLAMARALQNKPEPALQTLRSAVDRGENTAFRFEQHQRLAFKAIADDPTFGPQLTTLLKEVREGLIAK